MLGPQAALLATVLVHICFCLYLLSCNLPQLYPVRSSGLTMLPYPPDVCGQPAVLCGWKALWVALPPWI